nr:hypothetical protein [uncultured Kingella sp.]
MDIELNNGRIIVPHHPELSVFALNVHHAEAGDGIALPIIIHNGDWFVSNGFFYGSGYADCWQMDDAENLKHNIDKGWLAAHIPDRSKTNFSTLGYRQTDDGRWLFDRETYKAHALGLLNQLPHPSEPRPQPSQRLLSETVFIGRTAKNGRRDKILPQRIAITACIILLIWWFTPTTA